MTAVTTQSGAKTSIEYDADGNPITMIDPRGHETTRSYDVMDRLEAETDPLGRTAEWSYYETGDVESTTDRNGSVTTFAYDPLRRLTDASFGVSGLSSESSISYEYDEAGRPIKVDDSAAGEYAIGYTEFDKPEYVEGPNGIVSYSYDAAGRREAMLVPGQSVTEYSFDDADQLIGITRGSEAVGLEYDKAGRPEAVTLPDGIEMDYGYDAAGQATSITYKDGESSLGAIDYAYDPDGQLEATWGSYARTDVPESLGSTEYNAANELVEREGEALEYDKNGNLIADENNEYSWNERGQLTGISGSESAAFTYDPFGRRSSKTLKGVTTDLLYDEANVVQESRESSVVADVLSGLKPDQLFSRTTEAGTDSYLTDRLGSVVALANELGEVKTAYSYEPFGASSVAGSANGNTFQFTGRENDGTGLQYNRARYYSPLDGRFISRDPLGFAGGGANLYWYGLGDPVDYTDPSGMCVICIDIPNPIAPIEDAVNGIVNGIENVGNQIGDWGSEAAGALSAAAGWIARETDVSTEELIGAVASTIGTTAMCGIAGIAASAVGTPAAGVAAYAFCTSIEVVGAYESTTDILDHDNEFWTNELFR